MRGAAIHGVIVAIALFVLPASAAGDSHIGTTVRGAGYVSFAFLGTDSSFSFAVNATRSPTGEISGHVNGAQYGSGAPVRFTIEVTCFLVSGNRVQIGGRFTKEVDSGVTINGVPQLYTHASFGFGDNGVPSSGTPDEGTLNLWVGFPPETVPCSSQFPEGPFPPLVRGNVIVESS
jgi:hypothetical protein